MRRTASLSIFDEEKDNNLANIDHLFSVNKKCKLEIGIKNTVQKEVIQTRDEQDNPVIYTIDYQQKYGEVVWYPLGIYIMFNPYLAHSITGVTISMNLKDKMCLLNGDLGGRFIQQQILLLKMNQLMQSAFLQKKILFQFIIL